MTLFEDEILLSQDCARETILIYLRKRSPQDLDPNEIKRKSQRDV